MIEKKYIVLDIETTGLNPINHKITCICAKTNDANYFYKCSTNEYAILIHFYCWIINKKDYIIITKNGKQFDIPFIISRSVLTIDGRFHVLIDIFKHIDIQEVTKKRISLDDMATLLKLSNKSADGLQAIKWFKEKKYSKIIEYCMNDVLLTEKVYKKLYK